MLFGFPFDSTVFLVFLVTAWTVAVNTTVLTATEAGSIRGARMSTVRNDDSNNDDRDNINNNNFVRRRKLVPGTTNDGASSFVVAEDADSDAADEHPYFAQLVIKDERYSYNCGGALITPHVVLTAAHCTDGIVGNVTEIGAYVGSRNYRSADANVEYRTCAEFLVHPSYVPVLYDDFDGRPVPGTGVTGGNDFALCKLDVPVRYDAAGSNVILFLDQEGDDDDLAGKIAAASAAADDEAPPPVTMMGFDRTTTSSSDPGGTGDGWTDVLQTVNLPLYDNENDECDRYYGGVGIIDETMICAWDRKGVGAECFGNSGGPLVHKDGSVHTLLGVSSFSASSSCGSSPSVFSRVSKAVDWVKANMSPSPPT